LEAEMKLSERALIHADKMDDEGWYVTANILAACAEALDEEPTGMTPKQYKTIIEQLGLSQERAGEWLGVSARTGQNYAAKGPPEPVAKLLRLMVRLKLNPEDVK
jgi:DNA-binding transcriptional regulator YiaG